MTTIYISKSKGYYIVAAREHADDPIICGAISSALCGLYNAAVTIGKINVGECEGFSERSGRCTIRFSGGIEANSIYTYAVEIFKLLEATNPKNIKIMPIIGGEIFPD